MISRTLLQFFKSVLALALFVLLSVGAVHAQTAGTSGADAGPAWAATDAQMALLGPLSQANGYTLRPPLNFITAPDIASAISARTPAKMNAQAYAWRGAYQKDVLAPLLVAETTVITTDAAMVIPPGAVLTGFLTSFQKTRTNVVQSRIELGQIAGLPAARAYWKNVQTRPADHARFKMRGFAYVLYNQPTKTAVIIWAEDSEPYYEKGPSAAMEAAVLSLKPN